MEQTGRLIEELRSIYNQNENASNRPMFKLMLDRLNLSYHHISANTNHLFVIDSSYINSFTLLTGSSITSINSFSIPPPLLHEGSHQPQHKIESVLNQQTQQHYLQM